MKLKTYGAVACALFIATVSFAQTKAKTTQTTTTKTVTKTEDLAVSDEEILKYATAMDSISEMQAAVKVEIGDMIKNGNVMDVARYGALSKIINDPAQLESAKATPEEIAFVKQVQAKQVEDIAKIKTAYQNLAKDYVTPKVFNKVKKAIDTDQEVKQKYDSLIFVLGQDNTTQGQ